MDNKILQTYYYFRDFFRKAIFVYTIPKTGSSSVHHSLRAYGLKRVYHLHNFMPTFQEKHVSTWHRSVSLFCKYFLTKRSIFIISCLREPISAAISDFFQQNREKIEEGIYSLPELIDLFKKKAYHNVLHWFDNNMKREIGMDVYSLPFDPHNGFGIYKIKNVRLLLLKVEYSDDKKEKLLKDFLGLKKEYKYFRSKMSSEKNELYIQLYGQFKDRLNLSSDEIKKILDSKYCRYFYSQEEREATIKKWTN